MITKFFIPKFFLFVTAILKPASSARSPQRESVQSGEPNVLAASELNFAWFDLKEGYKNRLFKVLTLDMLRAHVENRHGIDNIIRVNRSLFSFFNKYYPQFLNDASINDIDNADSDYILSLVPSYALNDCRNEMKITFTAIHSGQILLNIEKAGFLSAIEGYLVTDATSSFTAEMFWGMAILAERIGLRRELKSGFRKLLLRNGYRNKNKWCSIVEYPMFGEDLEIREVIVKKLLLEFMAMKKLRFFIHGGKLSVYSSQLNEYQSTFIGMWKYPKFDSSQEASFEEDFDTIVVHCIPFGTSMDGSEDNMCLMFSLIRMLGSCRCVLPPVLASWYVEGFVSIFALIEVSEPATSSPQRNAPESGYNAIPQENADHKHSACGSENDTSDGDSQSDSDDSSNSNSDDSSNSDSDDSSNSNSDDSSNSDSDDSSSSSIEYLPSCDVVGISTFCNDKDTITVLKGIPRRKRSIISFFDIILLEDEDANRVLKFLSSTGVSRMNLTLPHSISPEVLSKFIGIATIENLCINNLHKFLETADNAEYFRSLADNSNVLKIAVRITRKLSLPGRLLLRAKSKSKGATKEDKVKANPEPNRVPNGAATDTSSSENGTKPFASSSENGAEPATDTSSSEGKIKSTANSSENEIKATPEEDEENVKLLHYCHLHLQAKVKTLFISQAFLTKSVISAISKLQIDTLVVECSPRPYTEENVQESVESFQSILGIESIKHILLNGNYNLALNKNIRFIAAVLSKILKMTTDKQIVLVRLLYDDDVEPALVGEMNAKDLLNKLVLVHLLIRNGEYEDF